MTNERFVENIKVLLRKNNILLCISKLLYSPFRIYGLLKRHCRRLKLASSSKKQFNSSDKSPKIYYLGVPTHRNLGDAAQCMCIRRWIKNNYPKYKCIELTTGATYINSIRALMLECITKDDIIVFESGATFSHRHEDHAMHCFVLENFKDNQIIFMPQTVDLSNIEELKAMAARFNEASKAFFLARDIVSFNNVSLWFDNNRIELCPDIVTTLIGNLKHNNVTREGILLCKRIDGEKIYTDSSVKGFIEKLQGKHGIIDWTDTNFFHSYEETMSNIEKEISDIIDHYSHYKVIITDRYHGMIFSLISDTPVVVLGTNGHKVKEGALWFKKDYPNSVYFCDNLEDAERTVNSLMANYVEIRNDSIYKERYYAMLKDKITEILKV